MATWPSDDLTSTHLDQSTDDPSQARAELLALLQKVQTMLASAGNLANQVALNNGTVCANLNADKVDGYDFDQSLKTTDSPTFAAVTAPLTGNVTGNADTATTATGVNDVGGGTDLKVKVIDIGDWNMVSVGSVTVAHGLTVGNIRSISVLTRDDAGGDHIPLNWDYAPNGASGRFYVDATYVHLFRESTGTFNDILYDSTSYNRGWITIWYV